MGKHTTPHDQRHTHAHRHTHHDTRKAAQLVLHHYHHAHHTTQHGSAARRTHTAGRAGQRQNAAEKNSGRAGQKGSQD